MSVPPPAHRLGTGTSRRCRHPTPTVSDSALPYPRQSALIVAGRASPCASVVCRPVRRPDRSRGPPFIWRRGQRPRGSEPDRSGTWWAGCGQASRGRRIQGSARVGRVPAECPRRPCGIDRLSGADRVRMDHGSRGGHGEPSTRGKDRRDASVDPLAIPTGSLPLGAFVEETDLLVDVPGARIERVDLQLDPGGRPGSHR